MPARDLFALPAGCFNFFPERRQIWITDLSTSKSSFETARPPSDADGDTRYASAFLYRLLRTLFDSWGAASWLQAPTLVGGGDGEEADGADRIGISMAKWCRFGDIGRTRTKRVGKCNLVT
eukprot:5955735-Pleurochrysis_carterae.AAC.1